MLRILYAIEINWISSWIDARLWQFVMKLILIDQFSKVDLKTSTIQRRVKYYSKWIRLVKNSMTINNEYYIKCLKQQKKFKDYNKMSNK